MDPQAVRPDRDLTGKQKVPRARKRATMDEELLSHMVCLLRSYAMMITLFIILVRSEKAITDN